MLLLSITSKTICNVLIESVCNQTYKNLEILLVDDGSTDGSALICDEYERKDARIRAVKLAKNFGQHSALMAGYTFVTGDYIATLDDDGQTPAEEVFKLVDKVKEGYDVAYGYYAERKDNIFRKFGTMMNNKMLEMMIEKPKEVHLTSYFVAKRYIIDEIYRWCIFFGVWFHLPFSTVQSYVPSLWVFPLSGLRSRQSMSAFSCPRPYKLRP